MNRNSDRPASAQSKNAWNDRPASRTSKSDGFDDDDMPTAMESEMYVDGEVHVMGQPAASNKQVAVSDKKSCCQRFQAGVRCLWGTRMTEDTGDDRELHVRTTLRELIVYSVFLVILCILTFGMTSSTMYYYTKVMSELFLDSQFPDTKNTFRGMTTMQDFWRFAENPMLDGLYWDKWYNDLNVIDDDRMIYYENKLLGIPRLRQLKVHNASCTVHSDFETEIQQCFAAYAESVEDKAAFGKMNGTAWTYQSEDELDGSGHWGLIASYGGGGFVQELSANRTETQAIMSDLKKDLWIDRGTRVVFLDFTVYNANINLFCQVRLLVELPATGGAIPSWTFRTIKLLRYVSISDYIVLGCEGVFCLFILYYIIEESLEIKKHKLGYFKSFWNILDLAVILASIIAMAFNIYRTLAVDSMLENLLKNPDVFPDFEFLGFWQEQFNNGVAITVFAAWCKIFKYISFNKTMTQLSSTLGKCAKDLGGFAVMFFIIFFAFSQLGYLIFGTQVKDFSTVKDSMLTLMRIVLGDFDFHELESANRVLGPLFFMVYVFFVFFVLLNMFLAIINDTYSEVKADLATQESEFEMGDYFKQQYDKMLNKLNLKRDKIVDIQKALVAADGNADKRVDFEEWRQELKMRGYADSEIEAAFAKYDLDGDRVLDEVEQKQMQADLEGQKDAITKEYAQIEDKANNRPKTGRSRSFEDSGEDSDDEDTSARTKSSRGARSTRHIANGVSYEEFTVLSRRVDRMEHSIGSIVSKIDAVLVKLEAMEKAKLKRRETMGKILDSITESDGNTEERSRDQMEKLVREELERWDSETSIGQASGRGASPSSATSARGNRRSRPSSGNNTSDV